ncbi:MAG: crosslink repair DNA glycosylase YcaQ family protein [Thiolinea sp.]
MKTLALSPIEARRLVLSSQLLNTPIANLDALAATQKIIEHLGYIQIDTISVIERAHHHTLWTRNTTYQAQHLDQLLEQKQIFEYWSHAAAYLPMCDYRFSLRRKQALASGKLDHWYERDNKLMQEVLARISAEGPLMAKDFENTEKVGDWQSKPSKRALEYLFMQGELMIPTRKNFHKVYELTERVLPATVDTRTPSEDEYLNYLILHYLRAQGLAQETDFGHLIKGVKAELKKAVKSLLADGQLLEIKLNEQTWLSTPENLKQLDQPPLQNQLKILSPFDNLVIQRERMRKLFNFDYQLECYVPEAKRKYGYFVLPILWKGELVARMDCKAERKEKRLVIHQVWTEPTLQDKDGFREALAAELEKFKQFNRCETISGLLLWAALNVRAAHWT